MEQIELNHIAPYLPYGLKYKGYYGGVSTMRDIKHIRDYNEETDEYTPNIQVDGYTIEFIKPLLRPLSDLYKDIDGEVGIVEIFRMFGIYHENIRVTNCGLKYNDGAEWLLFDWSYSAQSFIDSDGGIYLNMESITYLFQHHYDVFLLIDKGLAIDLNSISHE